MNGRSGMLRTRREHANCHVRCDRLVRVQRPCHLRAISLIALTTFPIARTSGVSRYSTRTTISATNRMTHHIQGRMRASSAIVVEIRLRAL